MGEILRALLDASALDAQPAFYTSALSIVAPVTGAASRGPRSAVIQCKAETWFLMMAWTMNTSLVSSSNPFGQWQPKAADDRFSVSDGATTRRYSVSNVPKSLQGFTLNNIVTLPHYVLWRPLDLIRFDEDVEITTPVNQRTEVNYVTLSGIEYKMPPGFRG
jgi:hypothetical protein